MFGAFTANHPMIGGLLGDPLEAFANVPAIKSLVRVFLREPLRVITISFTAFLALERVQFDQRSPCKRLSGLGRRNIGLSSAIAKGGRIRYRETSGGERNVTRSHRVDC